MAIFKKDSKDTKDDYRAPSDTGSSDEPDVVAGTAKKSPGASPNAIDGSPGLSEGASTTTSTDSVVDKGSVETKSPNELDQRTPDERLKNLRGWRQKFRTGQPSSADWEEFEQLVGDGREVADARRP